MLAFMKAQKVTKQDISNITVFSDIIKCGVEQIINQNINVSIYEGAKKGDKLTNYIRLIPF